MDIRDDERLEENVHVAPPRTDALTPIHQVNDETPMAGTSEGDVPDDVAEPTPAPPASLLGADPENVQERWHDLQASFVDDPHEAIQRADTLLGEVTTSIRDALDSRVHELQDHWKNTGQSDTELLRIALRDYRDLLQRLLPLAGADDNRTR